VGRRHGALRAGAVAASAISLFEIATAIRRRRLVLEVPAERWLADLRMLPELHFEPVSAGIAEVAGCFARHCGRAAAPRAARAGGVVAMADRRRRRELPGGAS